jgi:hypothetical protein
MMKPACRDVAIMTSRGFIFRLERHLREPRAVPEFDRFFYAGIRAFVFGVAHFEFAPITFSHLL